MRILIDIPYEATAIQDALADLTRLARPFMRPTAEDSVRAFTEAVEAYKNAPPIDEYTPGSHIAPDSEVVVVTRGDGTDLHIPRELCRPDAAAYPSEGVTAFKVPSGTFEETPAAFQKMNAPLQAQEGAPVPASAIEPEAPKVGDLGLDADGFPWDVRIHSSAKTKTKDGRWKKLRGLDGIKLAQVERELRGAAHPVAPVAIPSPPVPVPPSLFAAPTPPIPQTPEAKPSVVGHTAPDTPRTISTLAELMAAITEARLQITEINAAANQVGLTNFMQLNGRPDLIPAIAKELGL